MKGKGKRQGITVKWFEEVPKFKRCGSEGKGVETEIPPFGTSFFLPSLLPPSPA